jgi:hypothetical protein
MAIKDRVGVAKFKDNCFILVSGARRPPEETFGAFYVKANMSFLYDAGDYAAEWEPEYGPIQVWHKCEADAENAKEHYYFDFTDSPGGSWSQLAVEEYQLPQAFHCGDYDYIFSVLKEWATRD